MIYRLLLSSLTIFTLATCQNQKTATAKKSNAVEHTKHVISTENNPIKETPKITQGIPAGKKVVKTTYEEKQEIINKKNVVYLAEGENKFLKEFEMNVTFKRMVEDSRCPKDVECIWAGNAMAEVELMGLYTRPVTIQLSTMNDTSKKYVNTQNFNGYSISLIEVTPETTSPKGFKALKGTYKIALQFNKEQPNPSERGGSTTK